MNIPTHCPKCGAELMDKYDNGNVMLFQCGTDTAGTRVIESAHCLKKQLAACKAELETAKNCIGDIEAENHRLNLVAAELMIEIEKAKT